MHLNMPSVNSCHFVQNPMYQVSIHCVHIWMFVPSSEVSPLPKIALLQLLTLNTSPSLLHYDDVIMTMLESQIISLTVVYSIVYSGVHQRKHQSSASLAFVREIHRGPVNFPHKWPVTRKMFPFDDVIMFKHYLGQILQGLAIHFPPVKSGP